MTSPPSGSGTGSGGGNAGGGGNTGGGSTGGGSTGGSDTGGGNTGGGSTGGGDTGGGNTGGGDTGGGNTGGGNNGGGDTGGGDTGGGGNAGSDPPPLTPGEGSIGSERTVLLRQVPFDDWLRLFSAGSRVVLDDTLGVQSIGLCPDRFCVSRGTAKLAEAGSDPYTSWGRWTDGKVQLRFEVLGFQASLPSSLTANEGMHYLVGVPSVSIPTSGVFGYSLIGATHPTISNGSVAPGTFQATAGVAFAPGQAARVGLDGTVTIGGGSYGFATAGGAADPTRSTLATDASHAFSGTLAVTRTGSGPLTCGGTGCSVNLQGGLFGPDAARLGLSYQIQAGASGSPTISGVGVFQKQ